MDELVKLVAQKAGISEVQARAAVETMVAFIKQRLPDPFGAQVDALLKGASPELLKGFGSLFNK
jgi:nucleoid DNA-binding protein